MRGGTANVQIRTATGFSAPTLSLLLVAAAAGISWWQRPGLERQVILAAARALAQLLLVGFALTLIIAPGRPIW
jgi:putative ABC transport system permease protein